MLTHIATHHLTHQRLSSNRLLDFQKVLCVQKATHSSAVGENEPIPSQSSANMSSSWRGKYCVQDDVFTIAYSLCLAESRCRLFLKNVLKCLLYFKPPWDLFGECERQPQSVCLMPNKWELEQHPEDLTSACRHILNQVLNHKRKKHMDLDVVASARAHRKVRSKAWHCRNSDRTLLINMTICNEQPAFLIAPSGNH